MTKIKMIDLFAGCGGMTDGFLKTGLYDEVAAVEWLLPQVQTLRQRLKIKYGHTNATESVMQFDIQREEELFKGWQNDPVFDCGSGLDKFVTDAGGIDIIIGGPPCQAYSIAGRVRDENGMKNDYRNYLFEHYLNVVNHYRPVLFVFENVPGILSAAPDGTPITDSIKSGFSSIDYDILPNLENAKINTADYGVPQNRNRIIIIGIDRRRFSNTQKLLVEFYNKFLPKYKSIKVHTVKNAIGDLPACTPIDHEQHNNRKKSHHIPQSDVTWHIPRYHSARDMDTFKLLAEDIESGRREYDSKRISELYEEKIGAKSPIHRYHVLEADLPSTTIIAHLYKDGNRFIHYDSKQARTLTVREAARIQSFDDDFDFIGSQGNAYQMVGNAVPPKFAKCLGFAVSELLEECEKHRK